MKGVNRLGLTMEEEYARWLDGRRTVYRNLKGIRNDFGLVDTGELGMTGVDECLPAVLSQLDDAIEEAKRCVVNPSYRELLHWTGPFGAVSHVAGRCRIALEDFAAETNRKAFPAQACVIASRLFQKKVRNFGKWEFARGEVNGEPHVWCERNGVACDLTRTQYDSRAARVFVVPASRYPCTRRLSSDSVFINEETVEAIEKFYSCDDFVKRKHKAR